VKLKLSVLVVSLCTLASLPSLAKDSFQSLKADFNNSTAVTAHDLNGTFVGYCYTNPVTEMYINRYSRWQKESATESVFLAGKKYGNGFHVALLAAYPIDKDPELYPGADRAKYSKELALDPDEVEKVLVSTQPVAVENGDLVYNFLGDIDPDLNHGRRCDDMQAKQIFRKSGKNIIAELIQTDSRFPKELSGVTDVCKWFSRIQ
jgi:hypothetical protein